MMEMMIGVIVTAKFGEAKQYLAIIQAAVPLTLMQQNIRSDQLAHSQQCRLR